MISEQWKIVKEMSKKKDLNVNEKNLELLNDKLIKEIEELKKKVQWLMDNSIVRIPNEGG